MFRVAERVRICMLQAANVLSIDTSSDMFADRNALPAEVERFKCVASDVPGIPAHPATCKRLALCNYSSTYRTSIAALQSALGSSGDALGLATVANVDFADFTNAPLKVAGTTLSQTDAAAQPVRDTAL